MGHSHYLNIAHPISNQRWNKFTNACHRVFSIAQARGIALSCDYDEDKPPVASVYGVKVNGVGDGACETLDIPRDGGLDTWAPSMGPGWRFVKTYQRPYDAAVCAILAIGKRLRVLSSVASDGDASDWEQGLGIAREAMGEEVSLPFADER
jgi:hypothetical protein